MCHRDHGWHDHGIGPSCHACEELITVFDEVPPGRKRRVRPPGAVAAVPEPNAQP